MSKRRLKLRWTCSDYVKHSHRWRWSAWLCGRVQRLLRKTHHEDRAMNVYLIVEDGETSCVAASSMAAAVQAAEDRYIAAADPVTFADGTEAGERDYYRAEILQSCSLVAELVCIEGFDAEQMVPR